MEPANDRIDRQAECNGVRLNRPFARLMLACLLGLAVEISVSASTSAQVTKAAGLQTPLLMDRQKEISLALSACPPSVADKAAVYVLEKSGYVKVRESQNGFTAIVQHAAPTSQDPQCMDSEGARTFLPRILMVAELRSKGRSSAEIQAFVSDAVAKGTLPTPTRPGIIYMLGENLLPNGKGAFPPHVMFYGTHLINTDLGVDGNDLGPDGNPKGPAFVAGEGSPYSLVIVPVSSRTSESEWQPLITRKSNDGGPFQGMAPTAALRNARAPVVGCDRWACQLEIRHSGL